MLELPLIARARAHGTRCAVRAGGETRSYQDLLEVSAAVAAVLLGDDADLDEARVVFQAPCGFAYLAIQWGIWRAGGVAVPVSEAATPAELKHALADSGADHVITLRRTIGNFLSLDESAGRRLLAFEDITSGASRPLPEINSDRRAMILFTSGTTNKPKGVVTTHANIRAQIEILIEAWEWSADDRIPLFLPMHHVHGIINVASCALWAGATIEAYPKFVMEQILTRVADRAWSVFMAVPTIYVKLIEILESGAISADQRDRILSGFRAMRLMVSGSAALPASVHEAWTSLAGQCLLERYGMTETGMMISNPYHGERRPGYVGRPLPTVEIRLKSEQGEIITRAGEPGEIQVRGPVVFREYWNAPEVTAASFEDGWFRTGDLAVVENGYYRIMGRLSVDIIKSGGYKLSALEIEAALLDHPSIRECAVIGLNDETWGEVVAAAVVLNEGARLDLEELTRWSRERLSHYKIPRKLAVLESLPRNAMGKVTKRALAGAMMETAAR